MKSNAVIIVNLGTASKPTKKCVKKYLLEFLSDKAVIHMNKFLWFFILRFVILPLRTGKIAKLYKKIWINKENISPLLKHSNDIVNKLNLVNKSSNNIFFLAMRYGSPSIKETLRKVDESGIKTITILPLYPQYSKTTTETVFDKFDKEVSIYENITVINKIKSYNDNQYYIDSLVHSIEIHLQKIDYIPEVILCSFHGIPQKYIDNGDIYYQECLETFKLLKAKLNITCDIFFQSRFGKKQWTKPYTKDIFKKYLDMNIKNIVVISPGFSVDCLETLYELAKEEKHNFFNLGGENYSVVDCLNSSESQIELINNILNL